VLLTGGNRKLAVLQLTVLRLATGIARVLLFRGSIVDSA
jgi:hypothetical protein